MKNGQEKLKFISDLIKGFWNVNTLNISDKNSLKCIVQEYMDLLESIWFKHSYLVNITKYSKNWWNKDC